MQNGYLYNSDGRFEALVECALYIAPDLKKTYATRTGRDMLEEALQEIVNLPEAHEPRILRGTVQFGFIGPLFARHQDRRLYDAQREFSSKIRDVLSSKSDAWHAACQPVQGLQGVLLDLMKDPEYKFRAFVHFASKHGADEALRIRDLMEVWR